jgi:hypothetical protein
MKLIIGLLSCEQHNDRDDMCRRTWIPKATALGIDVVFLRGGSPSGQAERHGDILLLPTPTDYRSLPQRTRAFCKWFLETDATRIFKADNDSWVCPERLLAFERWDADLFGNEPGGHFRGWVSGGAGYGLSRRAAEVVAEHLVTPVGAEDKLVTQVLSQHGIKPLFVTPRRFISWGIDAPDRRPTLSNCLISTHQISYDLWMKIHAEMYGSQT